MTTTTVLPKALRHEYPFSGQNLKLSSGHTLHYLDEGSKESEPLLMVHGNPTWSFYYRNLTKGLRGNFRVIAPDHIGCGLSEKPQDYGYSLREHIDNLKELYISEIKPHMKPGQKLNLIVHDWGGAIGLGLAGEIPEEIGKVVILNTAAFTDAYIPKRIGLCKLPVVGEPMVRFFNAFAWPATFMAVEKPLKRAVKKGYLYPYNNYANRIATARFVKDIPMNAQHPSWKTLKEVEDNLKLIEGEKLILWGAKDFCFTTHFFERWQRIYPKAKAHLYNESGHYILEDQQEDTLKRISEFLNQPMQETHHNIARALPQWAETCPEKVAVSAPVTGFARLAPNFTYEELTFKDLNSLSLFYAHQFIDSALVPGDKVLMFVKPSVDFSALTFGLFRAGLVPVFIDPGMGKKNLLAAIEHIRPDALIAEPIVHLLALIHPKAFSSIKYSFTMGRFAPGKLRSIAALKKKWNSEERKTLDEVMHPCSKETMAAVLFTSGGTGIPKAVHYNHGIFNAQVRRLQELFNLTPEDVDLPGFPLFSLFTITMGMKSAIPAMNPSKPASANPAFLVKNIVDHQATFVAGSPAIWQNLCDYCLKEGVTLPSVKYLVMFGAPVPLKLHIGFAHILPNGDTYTPYGATECLPVANISGAEVIELSQLQSAEEKQRGVSTCVGRPVESTEVRIAQVSDEAINSVDQVQWQNIREVGEICVYSETVTPEYIGMAEKTKNAKISDPRGGLWHRMGDLGYLDSDGKLWFCGRLTHRVVIGDKTTPCIPQESIYNSLTQIKRCAFIGPTLNGKLSPTLIIEPSIKLSHKEKKKVESEIFSMDKASNNLIERVIFTKKLPVDVRHNIKIDRLKLKDQVERGTLS